MNVYARLMRFDKPAGTVLLWAPTAWALWLANQGRPPVLLLIYFFLGTVIMRAAGCIINDIADRNIDKHVKRTRLRPLTSGEISLKQTMLVLGLLLLLAAGIALQLPWLCWLQAVVALALTILYPLCKRFFQAPQLILGLAFSMSIPMAYAASHVFADMTMVILMQINFLWIVAYDTIYAMVDREDDVKIGVLSTALLFGSKVILIIRLLQSISHGLWIVLAIWHPWSIWFGVCWLLALALLIYQNILLQSKDSADHMRAFLWNAMYGVLLWIGLF
ncbi:MAG: 4-hydroxybenzoate octaprenyltransferase [Gammaproteobacteria bacterium]|nr:4-hydroxybenzoate octaprenyltransferase [Gammaproteobacteria bacterium]